MVSAIKQYLQGIGEYPLLSASDEVRLAKAYRDNGDMEARELLINSNLRLVVSIATKYRNNHLELMDLISEGNMGLLVAVDKYNPDLGYRFSTCATPWIKQAITKAIIDKGKNIRIPAHIFQLVSKYRQAVEELSKHGETITEEQIAQYMGIEVDKVKNIEEWKQDTVSLATPLGDENEDTLEDLQADESNENPMQYAERKAQEEKIQNILKTLKPRTQVIMKMRYGLGKEGDPKEFSEPHTLEEIGDYLGITRERVRQVEKETLAKIRTEWNGEF